MTQKTIEKLFQQATLSLDEGRYQDACDVANKILESGRSAIAAHMASAIFIDAGACLANSDLVDKGVSLIQEYLDEIRKMPRYFPATLYNLANGFSSSYNVKTANDPCHILFRNTQINEAKNVYLFLLAGADKREPSYPDTLTNLGNCYDRMGRVVEALECYEKAIIINPNHAIAIGNIGLAQEYFARLIPDHSDTFLQEAYQNIRKALAIGVLPETRANFEATLDRIRSDFTLTEYLDKPLSYPGIKDTDGKPFESYLKTFCLKHNLYLNLCVFCKKCDAAVGDTLTIAHMAVLKEKAPKDFQAFIKLNPFFIFSSWFNQIKQDYVAARFNLLLSQYRKLDLDFVDKRVFLVDTFSDSVNNIYVQLLKSSFRLFYDLLDKIAFFINEYLALGIPQTRIDFGRLFKDENNLEIFRSTENFMLNAIYGIYLDIEADGPFKKLKEIRNALTHRFLDIKSDISHFEDDARMTEKELLSSTIELAKLTRSTMIYLILFLNIEENKKIQNMGKPLLPMEANYVPDEFKNLH